MSLLDRAALDPGTSSGLVIRSQLGHLCTKLIMYPGTFKLGSVSKDPHAKDHNIKLRCWDERLRATSLQK